MADPSSFSFGDVVLVPFPFTDQSSTQKRPAVVVSSHRYNVSRHDIVIRAITRQVRTPLGFGEGAWSSSGSAAGGPAAGGPPTQAAAFLQSFRYAAFFLTGKCIQPGWADQATTGKAVKQTKDTGR